MAARESETAGRALGLWRSTALVVGNMIGSGVFLLPASLALFGGISLFGWAFSTAGAVLLALVFALQIIMLPIYHGVLFADRQVRVLAMAPDNLRGLRGPLGIVDRTADHATLLGLDAAGKRSLATFEVAEGASTTSEGTTGGSPSAPPPHAATNGAMRMITTERMAHYRREPRSS